MRCHRFLKGEDTLVFAWAGAAPARAAAASGAPVDLPDATGRRDGSGVPGSQPIVACAGPGREPPRGSRRCARLTACRSPRSRASLAIASVALLAACSGDEKSVSDDRTPEEVMELAATTLDETSGVQLSLSSEGLPEGNDRAQGRGGRRDPRARVRR